LADLNLDTFLIWVYLIASFANLTRSYVIGSEAVGHIEIIYCCVSCHTTIKSNYVGCVELYGFFFHVMYTVFTCIEPITVNAIS